MADNTPPEKTVLIAGASVRALAFSCLRAGTSPWCMDCFADHDLALRCESFNIQPGYPRSIINALEKAPSGPFLYTGGLENHPQLLERIQLQRPIAGIHGQSLQKLRNAPQWSAQLEANGLRVPRIHESQTTPRPQIQWLAKPLHSSGGKGIFPTTAPPPAGFFLQEFIQGQPRSASFCFFAQRWQLLGATLQIPPQPWLHSSGFQYSGNIGPIALGNREKQDLESIAESLAGFAQPLGLVNLDYMLAGDRAIPLEINPRYSASMELLELALGRSLIRDHLKATGWEDYCLPDQQHPAPLGGFLGKAIFYARQPGRFPPHPPEFAPPASAWSLPEFADIPTPGQSISPGQPVLSLFARSSSPEGVLPKLKAQSERIELFLATERFIT